jgi:hypothetical protein
MEKGEILGVGSGKTTVRPMGYDKGLDFWISPDFDDYLPPEFEPYT